MTENFADPATFAAEEQVIMEAYTALVDRAQKLFRIAPNMESREQKLEVVGELVSKYCKWEPGDIADACSAAFQDANMDEEAYLVKNLGGGIMPSLIVIRETNEAVTHTLMEDLFVSREKQLIDSGAVDAKGNLRPYSSWPKNRHRPAPLSAEEVDLDMDMVY